MDNDRYSHCLAKFLLWFHIGVTAYAITLGQTTYYSCPKEDVDGAWRAHENQHKVQWRRDGYVVFVVRYFWYMALVGYEKNPYEIEAEQARAKWGETP